MKASHIIQLYNITFFLVFQLIATVWVIMLSLPSKFMYMLYKKQKVINVILESVEFSGSSKHIRSKSR